MITELFWHLQNATYYIWINAIGHSPNMLEKNCEREIKHFLACNSKTYNLI